MSKIWIVERGNHFYPSNDIQGVFDSQEKATVFVKRLINETNKFYETNFTWEREVVYKPDNIVIIWSSHDESVTISSWGLNEGKIDI